MLDNRGKSKQVKNLSNTNVFVMKAARSFEAPQEGAEGVRIGRITSGRGWPRHLQPIDRLGVDDEDVLWVSATTGSGIPELRAELDEVLTAAG